MTEWVAGKRVLVTGHTGFKGSWLCLWLTRLGADVTGIALDPAPGFTLFDELKPYLSLEDRRVDIRDRAALADAVEEAQPEIVFHLAAQALVLDSYRDPLATWATNVQGTLNLLDAIQRTDRACAVVIATTDKVYENREWVYAYRETDPLGGHDPYSASKAACEIAVASWRSSFCTEVNSPAIATARAGNVIGGGDRAQNRIVPDIVRALEAGETVDLRNPSSVRPWQHVLEPLAGYLMVAKALSAGRQDVRDAFNFGPDADSFRTVAELVAQAHRTWSGTATKTPVSGAPHEAGLLKLATEKARAQLGWVPRWGFEQTVARTIAWYRDAHSGQSAIDLCSRDIEAWEAA